MSRIFMSHSSVNGAEAIALRDWLIARGWDDIFLDLDPQRGFKAGERWQAALKQAAERCEMVIFLVSPAWAASHWCVAEFMLANYLNKRIFSVIVEPVPLDQLPGELPAEWQMVDLTAGVRDYCVTVPLPEYDKTATVAFSQVGLERLRIGLMQAGLDARYFSWPPEDDPERAPYRGLRPLDVQDAGIFFGREGPTEVGLELLRGLREAPPPSRLLVILGASGAGKSSFMRAGLWPRLARDKHHFLPIPVIRPEGGVLTGEAGLIGALEAALKGAGRPRTRADIRTAVANGPESVAALLAALVKTRAIHGQEATKPPTIILCVDQVEELFVAEVDGEAHAFLQLVGSLVMRETPALIAMLTIRSDSYERLQTAEELEGVNRHHALSLSPMPQGSYVDVIKGPARRLEGSKRPLTIEESLVDALLSDIQSGPAKDALPLLGFTLERLYREYGADGDLKLSEYEQLGGLKGSIEAAVERAFKRADASPTIPKNREVRLTLLRRGLIPWLAGIDPDTGAPRRRLARLADIPAEARPLIDQLVEERLLSTDVSRNTGERTIEPAHEALLRQWGSLKSWLDEDSGLLAVLAGIKRRARDWEANGKARSWLAHSGPRLEAANRLLERADLAADLEAVDLEYILACQTVETEQLRSRRFRQLARSVMALILFILIAIPAFATVYLPIVGIPVNWALSLGIGASVGFFTGAFAISGTLLWTPILVSLGVPGSFAVGAVPAGIIGSYISSAVDTATLRNVNVWMTTILTVGGAFGVWLGVTLVKSLIYRGHFDFFVHVSFVLLLTVNSLLSLALRFGLPRFTFGRRRWAASPKPGFRFESFQLSGFPILLFAGICSGLLAATTGVGAAIVAAPAMIYLLRVQRDVALSTCLVHAIAIAALAIFLHAVINLNVDVVLAAILLITGIVGARFGARAADSLRNDKLRVTFDVFLLMMAFRLVLDLVLSPDAFYSVTTRE
jgi:uncharacterized membrane protein YfcA